MVNTIDQVFAVITIENGSESIIFAELGGKMIPFVTSSEEILDRMYEVAQKLAVKSQQEIKVIRFKREGELVLGDLEGEEFR